VTTYTWSVIYDGSVNIDDVQNISITKGRSQITDPFKGGTATISGREVSSLPALEIGKEIEIVATEGLNDFTMFHGIIADVQINFGIISAMDTYTISCEDALAIAGRGQTSDPFGWSAGLSTYQAAFEVLYNAFTSALTLSGSSSSSFVSGQLAPNANVLQLLNKIIATEQGYLFAVDPFTIQWIGRNEYQTQPKIGDFTDDTLITINDKAKFQNVTFRSYADSYFDQVVVEADGLLPRAAGLGNRVYTIQTFDETLGQAKNLADYLLATLQVQESVPSTLSTIAEIQNTLNVAIQAAQTAGSGRQCGLILRGDYYDVFVEGSTVTATPAQTRISLNLVSSEALSFFILDDPAFGRLDSDRLGF
jgi:hypothetical protein